LNAGSASEKVIRGTDGLFSFTKPATYPNPHGQLPERKFALNTNPTIKKEQAMKTISIIKVQKIALTKTVAACYCSCHAN
jgi:hypothetical protein